MASCGRIASQLVYMVYAASHNAVNAVNMIQTGFVAKNTRAVQSAFAATAIHVNHVITAGNASHNKPIAVVSHATARDQYMIASASFGFSCVHCKTFCIAGDITERNDVIAGNRIFPIVCESCVFVAFNFATCQLYDSVNFAESQT